MSLWLSRRGLGSGLYTMAFVVCMLLAFALRLTQQPVPLGRAGQGAWHCSMGKVVLQALGMENCLCLVLEGPGCTYAGQEPRQRGSA